MAQMITRPVVIEFLNLLTSRGRDRMKYKLVSVAYEDLKSKFKDKTLGEQKIRSLTGATVIAVKDNKQGLIPTPTADTFIGVGDTMVILCAENESEKLIHMLTGN